MTKKMFFSSGFDKMVTMDFIYKVLVFNLLQYIDIGTQPSHTDMFAFMSFFLIIIMVVYCCVFGNK